MKRPRSHATIWWVNIGAIRWAHLPSEPFATFFEAAASRVGLGERSRFYAVPDLLTATHGAHPVSFQLFFRLRPPASGGMGRMWNMRMSQPMGGHMQHQMPARTP